MSYETTTHIIPDEHDRAQVKKIWRTFWLLLFITIAELGLGLSIYTIHKGADPNQFLVLVFKGIVCILTLAKAFYIISIFMHLGDEIRNLIMTIAVPATIFIWFIIAFLYDGNSWKILRNTDAGSHPSTEHVRQQPVPAVEKGEKN